MSLLIISDVIPGDFNVGGIILGDIVSGFPDIKFAVFAVCGKPNPESSQPSNAKVFTRPFSNETSRRHWRGWAGTIGSILQWMGKFRFELHHLVDEVVTFAEQEQVNAILVTLSTPSLIALGPRVAQVLNVPLYSLVWDDPDYILRNHCWDRFSRNRMLSSFYSALSHSRRVAVVSDSMIEEYKNFGARECIILRHGFPRSLIHRPTGPIKNNSSITIGFAGTNYALSSWNSFLKALDILDWKIGGLDIVVRLLGGQVRLFFQHPARVECLGWHSNDEVLKLLSECDLNYLPYPFDPSLSRLALLSFPTKLSTYVATGRPVFVHAPEYSSLRNFYNEYNLGAFCSSQDPGVIAFELEQLVKNPDQMRKATLEAIRAADEELNKDVFLDRFTSL